MSHHENTLRSGPTMTTTGTKTDSEDKMMSPRRVLVASSTLSNLGDGVQLAAMPLLALLAENSALSTGVVVFARIVPAFILAAPIGVLVDHFNRFLVAVAANVIRIAALILFSTLWLVDVDVALWHLVTLSVVLGGVEPLFETAAGAAIPQIVEDGRLHKYNSMISFVQTFANGVIGPVIGAALFAISPHLPLLTNTGFLLAGSALLIPCIAKTPSPVASVSDTNEDSGKWRTRMLVGLGIIGRNPILAALVLLTAGWNLIGWMPEGPLAYYVTEEVGASATAYSWILATTSIGSLVGASLAPLTRTSKARMLVLVTGTPIYGAAFVLVHFSPNIWVTAFIFTVQGLPLMLWSITATTLRQRIVDNRYLGRVNVVFHSASIVLGPLGMALGSTLAEITSARLTFLVAGSALCLLAVALTGWALRPGAKAARTREQIRVDLTDR